MELCYQKVIKEYLHSQFQLWLKNMAAGNIAIYYGAKGPNKSIVTACASGTHSIGDGFDLIRHGRAKAMIVGGTESKCNSILYKLICKHESSFNKKWNS